MPKTKKSDQKSIAEGSPLTLTNAEIRRIRKKYKDLQLKLVKVREELRDMMGHIHHCP